MSIGLTAEEILFVKDLFRIQKQGPISIDGPYGDPDVRKDPAYVGGKPYEGPSFVGCKYSECPSDYLLGLASFLEWTVSQDKAKGEEAKKSQKGAFYWVFAEKDALRARAWAEKNRGKTVAAPAAPALHESEEVPF